MNLKKAEKELVGVQELREKMFPLKRRVVLNCSKAIRAVHVHNYAEAKQKLSTVEKDLKQLEKGLAKHPELKGMAGICYQEYAELKVLLSVLKTGKLPELRVPPAQYVLGVLDAIGEMKRSCLDLLMKGKREDALELYDKMEEIYYQIEGYAFPSSLVPGLKPKQDAMKRAMEGLYSTLVESKLR